jgi:hypothetical protein
MAGNAPIERPDNRTFDQMIHPDQMQAADQALNPSDDFKRIFIKLQGVILPIEVDVRSLGSCLGWPDYDLVNQGFYHPPRSCWCGNR